MRKMAAGKYRYGRIEFGMGAVFILLSFLFQAGSVVAGKFASLTHLDSNPFTLLLNPYYLATIACLFLQALTWQQTLRYYPLSWSYMFMSGIYPVIMITSYFIFGEQITTSNVVGAVIIVGGVINLLRKEQG